MNVSNSGTTVFNWLSDLSSITGLITWGSIHLSFIRFYYGCKRQGIDRSLHPFVAPFQPWLSYFGLVMVILVIIFNGYTVFLAGNWNTSDFFVDYITVLIFAILFVFWKLYKKTKFVSLDLMDFDTGRRELDDIADAEAARYIEPTTFAGKVWAAIM